MNKFISFISFVSIISFPHSAEARSDSEFDPDIYCTSPDLRGIMLQSADEWLGMLRDSDVIKSAGVFTNPNAKFNIESKVKSYEPGEWVICTLNISSSNPGREGLVQLNNVDFLVEGNEDGTKVWATRYGWPEINRYSNPTEEQIAIVLNFLNEKYLLYGQGSLDFAAAKLKKDEEVAKINKENRPKNIFEALAGVQKEYNNAADQYLRSQGVDVDSIRREEELQTKRDAPACKASGGTWGYPTKNGQVSGALGCYHQVIVK